MLTVLNMKRILVLRRNCRVCTNLEMQIVQLENVSPRLDKEKIKLEIEKN